MLLLSNFQDYYDYMIGITGVDPKIVFIRKKLKETKLKETLDFNLSHSYRNTKNTYYVLSICGKRYFIKSKKDTYDFKWSDFHLITKKDLADDNIFIDIRQFIDQKYIFRRSKRSKKYDLFDELHGISDDGLINISKKINMPIFVVTSTNRNNSIQLHENSPKLKDIKGISNLLEPKELFNNISFFIANVLNNSNPDIIQISNKDKIIKAGFDLKTSFRNM